VDGARLRRLWVGVGIGALVVLLLLFNALQQFQIASLGYEIQQVQQAREREEHVREHLRLELDTLLSPARLAEQAPLLDLAPPDPASTVVIQRVVTSTPPGQAVVAAR
jgi:hypothetical protein